MKIKTIISTALVSTAVLYFAKQSVEKQTFIGDYVKATEAVGELAAQGMKEDSLSTLVTKIAALTDAVEGIGADLLLLEEGKDVFASMNNHEKGVAKGFLMSLRSTTKHNLDEILVEMQNRS